jgi:hypothetical protein
MFPKTGPFAMIGTTPLVFIPRGGKTLAVRPGQDYFFVQICGAQVAFKGSIWQQVKNLVVATKVQINHPALGQDGLRSIQRTREVQQGVAEQLGLRPNLINLVPAVMSDFSISVDFILDKTYMLRDLSRMINDDSFLAAVSLAPGAVMVAKTISGLAGKIIETFVPAEERQPILQFSGDFNLADDCLKDGFYVILGTRDDHNPLPKPLPPLQVIDGILYANNEVVTQYSYLIIDIHRTPVRTRALNDGAVWEGVLREAENEASLLANDPFASDSDRKSTWVKCRNLLKDAQALLRKDNNYHRQEAENIIIASFAKCAQSLKIQTDTSISKGVALVAVGEWQPNLREDRALLEISPDVELGEALNSYELQVAETQRMLRDSYLS